MARAKATCSTSPAIAELPKHVKPTTNYSPRFPPKLVKGKPASAMSGAERYLSRWNIANAAGHHTYIFYLETTSVFTSDQMVVISPASKKYRSACASRRRSSGTKREVIGYGPQQHLTRSYKTSSTNSRKTAATHPNITLHLQNHIHSGTTTQSCTTVPSETPFGVLTRFRAPLSIPVNTTTWT